MLYGMSYDEYWFGDPWMARAFAQYHLLKRRQRNEEMWLQGIYMANAFQAVIGTAFGKKQVKYFEKPLDIFEKTESEKEQEIRNERQKLINYLTMLKKAADHKQGDGKNGKP